MPEKIKFIRKEWARVKAFFDRLPQVWFLVGGAILFALTFGVTFYETVFVNLFGIAS